MKTLYIGTDYVIFARSDGEMFQLLRHESGEASLLQQEGAVEGSKPGQEYRRQANSGGGVGPQLPQGVA